VAQNRAWGICLVEYAKIEFGLGDRTDADIGLVDFLQLLDNLGIALEELDDDIRVAQDH